MSRDLRAFSRQTNRRLLLGFFIILFVVGDGLIWYFYGQASAMLGLVCLVAGIAPLLLIGLILRGLEIFVNRVREE